VFPDKLKVSKVIPIYKEGPRTVMSNYRPIALSSPFAKIIEKLMCNRLVEYFNKYNMFYDYQFGFRKGHSTSLAVLEVVNTIENELFSGN